MRRALTLLAAVLLGSCPGSASHPLDGAAPEGLSFGDRGGAPGERMTGDQLRLDGPRGEVARGDGRFDTRGIDAPRDHTIEAHPDKAPPPDLCPTTVVLPTGKDCVTVSCPACAPYPVGCQLVFSGGDAKGCVASSPGSPQVFFKEGDQCGSGAVTGLLFCAAQPGAPLGPTNCPIPRPTPLYKTKPGDCPG